MCLFYGSSFLNIQNTHLASSSSTAQGNGPGTMGTAVGVAVRGRGRPVTALGRVSRAPSAAIAGFLVALLVPWALLVSFVLYSVGALVRDHGRAPSGVSRGRSRRRAMKRARVPRAQPAPAPGLRGTVGPPSPLFPPSSRGAGALIGKGADALLGGLCAAATVWQRRESGSPGRGPRLGLPDAARSRGLQVPQEGSFSFFGVARTAGTSH